MRSVQLRTPVMLAIMLLLTGPFSTNLVEGQEREPGVSVDRGDRRSGLTVVQRGSRASMSDRRIAFDDLAKRGFHVVKLGRLENRSLVVPSAWRHRPVQAAQLVRATAAAHKIKVHEVPSGRGCVLYSGAPDAVVKDVLRRLRDPRTRRAAAWECRGIEDYRVIEPLVDAATKGTDSVFHEVCESLAFLGLEAAALICGERALRVLEGQMAKARWTTRGLFAVGIVGTPRAVELVSTYLRRKEPAIQYASVRALRSCHDRDGVARLLERSMDRMKPDLRRTAIEALGYIGERQTEARLNRFASNREMRISVTVARARLGSKEALSDLIKLASTHRTVPAKRKQGMELIKTLCELDSEAALRLCLARAEEDERYLYGLGLLGGDAATERLEHVVRNVPGMRPKALGALGEIGGDRATRIIQNATGHADRYTRSIAFIALNNLGDKEVLQRALRVKWRSSLFSAWASLDPEAATAPVVLALKNGVRVDYDTYIGVLPVLVGNKALPLIKQAIDSGHFREAAYALLNTNGTRALDLLRRLKHRWEKHGISKSDARILEQCFELLSPPVEELADGMQGVDEEF